MIMAALETRSHPGNATAGRRGMFRRLRFVSFRGCRIVCELAAKALRLSFDAAIVLVVANSRFFVWRGDW